LDARKEMLKGEGQEVGVEGYVPFFMRFLAEQNKGKRESVEEEEQPVSNAMAAYLRNRRTTLKEEKDTLLQKVRRLKNDLL
jgi:hypothetical protein